MSFPPEFLKRWRNGDYSLLTSANIPSYIKQIIVQKAKVRHGRMSIMFMDCFPKKEDWPEQGIECLSKKGLAKAKGPILPAEDY